MGFKDFFDVETSRLTALSIGLVVTEKELCVQCGICTYNCPIGIDIRKHVWDGTPIYDSNCLTCGECLNRCPRGVLRFEKLDIINTITN